VEDIWYGFFFILIANCRDMFSKEKVSDMRMEIRSMNDIVSTVSRSNSTIRKNQQRNRQPSISHTCNINHMHIVQIHMHATVVSLTRCWYVLEYCTHRSIRFVGVYAYSTPTFLTNTPNEFMYPTICVTSRATLFQLNPFTARSTDKVLDGSEVAIAHPLLCFQDLDSGLF
jgi:hypothetical protein